MTRPVPGEWQFGHSTNHLLGGRWPVSV